MSQEFSVSRRTSLKGLGAVGAALVVGGPLEAVRQAEPRPSVGTQGGPAISVVDVAAGRFAKGHS